MKTFKNFSVVILFILIYNVSTLQAQDNTSENPLKITTYIDSYYTYDFNKPNMKDRQYANMASRHNEFNINHAYLLGEYENNQIRGVLGLQTGTYPTTNYVAEPNELSKMIYKAYAGVKLSEKVWLDAGMFGGHTGYEAVESLDNEIYSRAISTEYTPYYETGVRVTAELSEKVTLTGVILNGWQNIAETNDSKSFGMNINYIASDALELNYGNYFGDEGNSFMGSRFRNYHHAYARYQFNDKFHAMLGLDFGNQDLGTQKENFYFVTFISQYKISGKISLALRLEQVDDEFQILVTTNTNRGFIGQVYTFNFNYHISENAMFRVESKIFNTDYEIFNVGESIDSNNEVLSTSLAIRF